MIYSYYLTNNPFVVSGGVFASEQRMGVHITSDKGFTVAVSPDKEFADFVRDASLLVDYLKSVDALYNLRERKEDGYILCDEHAWENMKQVMERLGIR